MKRYTLECRLGIYLPKVGKMFHTKSMILLYKYCENVKKKLRTRNVKDS